MIRQAKLIQRAISRGRLVITNHAVQRFRERVADIHVDKVRELLSHDSLMEKYLLYGPGTYCLYSKSSIAAVIRDATVVTVYSTNAKQEPTVADKLSMYPKYMDYYVNNYNKPRMKFETYFKLNWKPDLS